MNEKITTQSLNKIDLNQVCFFGLPIVMDTDREDINPGDSVLLNYKDQELAILEIQEKMDS